MGDLKKMFDPKAVALIGATEREGAPARVVLENLTRSGRTRIFPVNPRREKVLSLQCYPSVRVFPEAPDLAVIAVPAPLVPEVLEQCGQAGCAGAVIISTGFDGTGEEGRRLERRLVQIGGRYGIRIVGPASFGIIRPEVGLNASLLREHPQPGNIALVVQSGQLGNALLEWGIEARIGFSIFASLGSMVDVDFGDMIDFLGDDLATRSVLLNMEGVVNARKLMSAARGCARSKPIIVMKPGRFGESSGVRAGERDEGPGDDRVYEAALKRVGVVRVGEAKDLFHAAQLLDSESLPAGPRLAILGNAGVIGIMAADALMEEGGSLALLASEAMAELAGLLPPGWNEKNPVDLGADAHTDRYTGAMRTCLKDAGVDGLLVVSAALAFAPADLAHAIASVAKGAKKPIIATLMGGREMAEAADILRKHKVPAYATPEEAVKAYLEMFRYRRILDLLYETPADLPVDQAPPKHHLKALIHKALKEGVAALIPEQSAGFLKDYGIPVGRTADAGEGPPEKVDYELYLDMTRDRAFGSVIRFGLGGMGRDIFGDCAIGLPPLNQTLARRLIEESKASVVLRGYGGRKPADFLKLDQILISFSNLVVDFPEIASIEIDPLVVYEGETRALGARLTLDPQFGTPGHAPPHLVITPYPTRYIIPWRLRDGTEVLLRPIRPEDEPLQHDLFSTLSEETVRERFFSVIKEMTHEMLVRFCNIDYDREIAIVAEVRKGDERTIVGISRLIIEPGARAQFAVLVHDDYQGKGLGYKLIDVLIGVAQEKGLEEIYGVTLSGNQRMLKLVRGLGFAATLLPEGITGVKLKLR